jgi:hypothetical protein
VAAFARSGEFCPPVPPMPTVFFTVHYFAAFHFEGYIF